MDVLRTPEERFENLPDFPFPPNYLEGEGMRMHYLDVGEADAPRHRGRLLVGHPHHPRRARAAVAAAGALEAQTLGVPLGGHRAYSWSRLGGSPGAVPGAEDVPSSLEECDTLAAIT